jgi:hypothetical protein
MRADPEFERERRAKPKRRALFGGGSLSRGERKAIDEFVTTRTGVEAFMEPRTLDQPLSVVLVAADGEWRRFHLPDERAVSALSRKKPVPVYEVRLVGYPQRMKNYRREKD